MTAPTLPKGARALVMGHFSTFGDTEVLKVVEGWLSEAGLPFDIAPYAGKVRLGNPDWVDPRALDAARYSHLLVVCGPFSQKMYEGMADIFAAFAHCTWIGVNLTMVAPLSTFQPFDVLLERDSDRLVRTDLSFTTPVTQEPVVGLCLATRQSEYGARRRHDEAGTLLRDLIRARGLSAVEMDTLWPPETNRTLTETADQFTSLAGRLDMLLTTRLHGLVLGLKAGTPVLALDAIAGGDKVTKQAGVIGWSEVVGIDDATPEGLSDALDRCLADEARSSAKDCATRAAKVAGSLREDVLRSLAVAPGAHHVLPLPPARRLKRRIRRLFGR